MKTIIMLLTLVMLYSCGDDTITSTGNNPTSPAIFFIDSFTIRSNEIGLFDTIKTYNTIKDLDSFRVSFSIGMNADTNTYNYAGYQLFEGSTINSQNTVHNFLNGYSYNYSGMTYVNNDTLTLKLSLGLKSYFNEYRYISIKNFKVETR